MLLSFAVTNFLSISERQTMSMIATKLKGPHASVEVSVPSAGDGILPCAIVYGPNASGKSSIVSAFARMTDLVMGSHSPRRLNRKLPYNPFLLSSAWAGEPTTFEISFIAAGIRYDYSFAYDDERILRENLDFYPEGRRRKFFDRDGDEISFGAQVKGAKKTISDLTRSDSLLVSVGIQNNHEAFNEIFEFFDSMYISTDIRFATKSLASVFSEHEIDSRSIKFLKLLGTGVVGYEQHQTDIDPATREMITEIEAIFRKQRPEGEDSSEVPAVFPQDAKEVLIRVAHENEMGDPVYFNVEQESLGTRRLLLMLNKIFQVLDEGDLAIVDELDASLHTFAVSAIVELFTNKNINVNNAQLIATTHDTNLLDTSQLRRDEVWFVEKSRGGFSEYFALSDFSTRRDEAMEKAYLEGRFGAVPKKFGHWNFQVEKKT